MKHVVILAVIALFAVSLLPVNQAEDTSFANPIFRRLWNTQSSAASTIDLWGSEPLLWRVEPYAGLPDDRRTVQYFDRGRMELQPSSEDGSPRVTQGLLALEMTTGNLQLGEELLERRVPADATIDGGPPDDRIPTYAGLSGLVAERAPDRSASSDVVDESIDATGAATSVTGTVTVHIAEYVEETGHNLPDVTVDLLDREPFGSVSWLDALGYPISEPYWTTYRRNNTAVPSLIQVFERRILVYSPSLPEDRQFTVTNIGRHYYRWRYGDEAPTQWPKPQAGIANQNVTVPAGFSAGIYAQDLGQPVGLALGPRGDLWVVTQQGKVFRIASEAENGAARSPELFADGLPNPRGIVVEDDAVYLTVDDGIIELRDGNNDAVADQRSYVTQEIEPASGPKGAPIADGSGGAFVAGTNLPARSERQVSMVELEEGSLTRISSFIEPGPLFATDHQMYVIDRCDPQQQCLYAMSRLQDGTVTDAQARIAEFSTSMTVNSILVFSSDLWPDVPAGTVFVAVKSESGGSLVQLIPRDGGQLPELLEFSTGFSDPVAMVAGLDGSLYVADAGSRQIIKIVANQRASSLP